MPLTWDDIENGTKPPAPSAKPALTWDDVEGGKPTAAPTSSRSSASEISKINAALRENEKKKADITAISKPLEAIGEFGRNVVSAVDIPLSMFGQAVGLGTEIGVRTKAGIKGYDRKRAAELGASAGARTAEVLGSPVQKLVDLVTPAGKKPDTAVNRAMQSVTKSVDSLGDRLEKVTGGTILKEDLNLAFNAAMTFLGTRAGEVAVGKKVPPISEADLRTHLMKTAQERVQKQEARIEAGE